MSSAESSGDAVIDVKHLWAPKNNIDPKNIRHGRYHCHALKEIRGLTT
jgi:hypothetical protein